MLGVQFDAIRQLRQSHFGRFWQLIDERYPNTADHGRLETSVLPIGSEALGPSFHLEVLDSPPTHRSWYMSENDERLVQLQDDRMVHNWRHQGGSYPRFEPLLDEFWNIFDSFRSMLERSGLEQPRTKQVEVAYINWIPDADPSEFLRSVRNTSLDVQGVDPRPDFEHWTTRYPVQDDQGVIGHLTIESKPGTRTTGAGKVQGYLLSFIYRASVEPDAGDQGVTASFLRGRDVIVRSFTAVTNDMMHTEDRWGRRA